MKKILLFMAAALAAICVSAQEREGTMTVQPRVGMNMSTMTDYNKTKFGYAFGMEMEYQMTDIVSLSAALMYSDQGADDDSNGTKQTLDLDFVNVPVMLNCYLLPGLAVKAGIQPAFRTKASVKSDGMKVDVDWLLDDLSKLTGEDVTMRKFMLSVPVGISYEYNRFVVDARYNFGLTPIMKGGDGWHNNVLQITLGYKFLTN